ncbi:CHAT domain-containing protein [Streptomyces sp. NPDC058739]|uniref:CHAT domain-containing protein n=1 Tax=Streptomyces sp. NPDC058739 TaxID=3346618 RepID=UPI0036A959A0
MLIILVSVVVLLFAAVWLGHAARVKVPEDHVGVVVRRLGRTHTPSGYVEFEDPTRRRVYAGTLLPGRTHWLLPLIHSVELTPRVRVPEGMIGVVRARAGAIRPPDQSFGRHVECDSFQDGQAFLAHGGQQGRQLAVLTGGADYDINPELFEAITVDNVDASQEGLTAAHLEEISIDDGTTGVVVTLVGLEPDRGTTASVAPPVQGHDSFRRPAEFLANGGHRGAQAQTLGEGTYALNPWFVRVMLVPARVLILTWSDEGETQDYDADLRRITVRVQGFELTADLSQTVRIPPDAAPRLVEAFAGVNTSGAGGLADYRPLMRRFVRDVLGVAVDGYFNQVALTLRPSEFQTAHEEIRGGLRALIEAALEKWGVEALETSLSRFTNTEPLLLDTGEEDFGGLERASRERESRRSLEVGQRAYVQNDRADIELRALVAALGVDNVELIRVIREVAGYDVPQYLAGEDLSAYLQALPLPVQDLLARLSTARQARAASRAQETRAREIVERIIRDGHLDDYRDPRTLVGDHHVPAPPDPPSDVPDDSSPPRRLVAELAEQAPPGREVPLQVQVVQAGSGGSGVTLRSFSVPVEGARLTIAVHAPGLLALGDLQQELTVTPGRDSDVLRFGLKTLAEGLHTVTVRAFRGGTFLGELRAQISVQAGTPARDGPTRSTPLDTLAFDPGEVTLQVLKGPDGAHSFQLLSETTYAPESFRLLAPDAHGARELIYEELRRTAGTARPHSGGGERQAHRRLRNLGVQLWTSAVPDAVRRQFWEESDRITAFTVLGEHDVVPWELLYPRDRDQEAKGFLAEWLPVVRRVFGQERVRELPLHRAAFVVPPGSPQDAAGEVTALRTRLGHTVADLGTFTHGSEVSDLIEAGEVGLLHFACHNTFTAAGSHVMMADGRFDPIDLAYATASGALRGAHPLVFFNACRSAGEIDWFAVSLGWAPQFLRAGAGAFVGTLWPVRSDSALAFADAFYDHLVTQGQTLSHASLNARQAIRGHAGDPSWLAYAVYGSPAACAARP